MPEEPHGQQARWTDENGWAIEQDTYELPNGIALPGWVWGLFVVGCLVGLWAIIIFVSNVARADPPAHATGQFHAYYDGLYDHEGGHCCGVADCRPTRYKEVQDATGTHYVAWLARLNKWVNIPDEKVIHYPNPTGHGTLCTFNRATYPDSQLPDGYVYCFNPWGDGG